MPTAISLIIPVYNAEENIDLVLDAVMSLDGPQALEVIVVDDGSTDRTPDIVARYSGVKLIRQRNSGPAAARNNGLRQARGEIVFFTDADCLPQPDWIERMLPAFDDADVAAACGSYGIANPEEILARCVHQEILSRHERLPRYPRVFGSYNFAVRRQVFLDVGGFAAEFRQASGEDNDLSYRLRRAGHRICLVREALVDHFHPHRVRPYLRDQFRHGYWRVLMYRRQPRMAGGDDYTVWKDIVEVPLSWAIILGLAAAFFVPDVRSLTVICALTLLVLEAVFSWKMMTTFREKSLFFGVMTARALARSAGFFMGLIAWPFSLLKSRSA